MQIPTCFLSYTWDNKDITDDFHSHLEEISIGLDKPISIIKDRETNFGGVILENWMAENIEKSDHFLILCTPEYKTKIDTQQGNVFKEFFILTFPLFKKWYHQKKLYPIILKGHERDVIPSNLSGYYYFDYTKTTQEEVLKSLINSIHGYPTYPTPSNIRIDTNPPIQYKGENDGK